MRRRAPPATLADVETAPTTSLERGWIEVPGLLDAAAAAALATRCEELLAGDDVRAADKRAGGTRRAAALLERLPELRDLVARPAIVDAVAALVSPPPPLVDVAFRSPGPGFGEQALHSDDLPLARVGDDRAVTAIVALCDFERDNGSTAVVPGSHRRPDLQRDAARLTLTDREVRFVGPAGTAFVFSAHLLHRGTRNRSDRPRPALQAQWRPAGTLLDPR